MGDPCHSSQETRCGTQTKEQRQSIMADHGTDSRSHPRHVNLANAQTQRPQLVVPYWRRCSGSDKYVGEAIDGKSASSAEPSHRGLIGRASGNDTNPRQYDQTSIASNVGNLDAVSHVGESTLVSPTGKAGKSYQARPPRPVKRKHNIPEAKRKGGSSINQPTEYSTEVVRNSGTRPPASFKQIWRRKENGGLTTESPQSFTNLWNGKDKWQNFTYPSKSLSKQLKIERSSRQSAHVDHIVFKDSNEPVGYTCYLCDNDLAHSPRMRSAALQLKSTKLPEVAILACGHVFHLRCMQHNMSDEQLKDPQCFLCDIHSLGRN